MKITVLSRCVLKNVSDRVSLFRIEIDVGSYGCLDFSIFNNQENQEVVTVLSDWIDKSKFQKFEKSEIYHNLKSSSESIIDYELLAFKDSLVYSNEISELFSISRSYVKNYDETMKMFLDLYTPEEANKLGILSIKYYLVITNENLVIALINWKNRDSHNSFVERKLTPNDISLGEYGTDRYGLMYLVDTWSITDNSNIKEN